MISKYRSPSISIVHFKRSLLLPPTSSIALSQTTINGRETAIDRPMDPKFRNSLPMDRSRASMGTPPSAHYGDSHFSTQSFCSDALKALAKMGSHSEGKQMHSHLCKLGYFYSVLSLQNQLINVYVKCGEFCDAQKVFDEMPVRNLVTWNTIICGAVECSRSSECVAQLGFLYFRRMLIEMVDPNCITLNGLLRTCAELDDVDVGRQMHGFIMKWGFYLDSFVGSALVDLYAKLGLVEDARLAFEQVVIRDLVLWNVIISCYVLNSSSDEAFRIYNAMRLEGGKGDDFTYTTLLSSFCTPSSCELGKQIHGFIIRLSYDLDVLVSSALVDMYAKNDNIGDARRVFDEMTAKNIVSWTTMIVGYGRNGDGKEAMKLLQKMFREDLNPDELTLASVLSSCANLSAITEVEHIHAYLVKIGMQAFSSISNALINAYSKCGSIARALASFKSISKPSVVAWTSLVGAYAFHGLSKESIEYFQKMLSNGTSPDKIAFLGVLSACSHGGLVSEGLHFFNLMTECYQIVPDSEHYTCIVDLLGRAGLLDEASNVLASMPIEPESNIFGAFIGACKVHGNVELAQWAAEKLFMLEPRKPANYTLMSNMYACTGRWLDVSKIRKMMRDKCGVKVPGCSWVEIAGEIHSFLSSDESHPQTTEVQAMLRKLVKLMKEDNNVPSTSFLHETLGEGYPLAFVT